MRGTPYSPKAHGDPALGFATGAANPPPPVPFTMPVLLQRSHAATHTYSNTRQAQRNVLPGARHAGGTKPVLPTRSPRLNAAPRKQADAAQDQPVYTNAATLFEQDMVLTEMLTCPDAALTDFPAMPPTWLPPLSAASSSMPPPAAGPCTAPSTALKPSTASARRSGGRPGREAVVASLPSRSKPDVLWRLSGKGGGGGGEHELCREPVDNGAIGSNPLVIAHL